MSVGAQLWRQFVSRVEAVPQHDTHRSVATSLAPSGSDAVYGLTQELFFPLANLKRRSILFAAVDSDSKASGFSEQVAITLSHISGAMVAIVESTKGEASLPLKKQPTSVSRSVWQASTVPVSERVRRVPCRLVSGRTGAEDRSTANGLNDLRGAFEYFVLSATVADGEMSSLCSMCDAAILVVTANVTRKQAALRAKEQLLRQGVTLLGTVLDQRILPIPESIYKWL